MTWHALEDVDGVVTEEQNGRFKALQMFKMLLIGKCRVLGNAVNRREGEQL